MSQFNYAPQSPNKYWDLHKKIGLPAKNNHFNEAWRRFSKFIKDDIYKEWTPGGRVVQGYGDSDVYFVDGSLRHLSAKIDGSIRFSQDTNIDGFSFPDKLLEKYPFAVLALSGISSETKLEVDSNTKESLSLVFDDEVFSCATFVHVHVGENSDLHLNWSIKSRAGSFSLPFIVIHLEKGATVENAFLFEVEGNSASFVTIFYNLASESKVKNHNTVVSDGFFRKDMFTYVDGENADFDDSSISLFGNGFGEVYNQIEHAKPNSKSVQNVRTLTNGSGVGSWQGMAKVYENCEGTDAEQNHKGLILSKDSRIHMKPQLEILTDDVVCGHGASLGQLDEESIFYMMTRGLDKELAKKLLIEAFISSSYEDFEVDNILYPSIQRNVELVLSRIGN